MARLKKIDEMSDCPTIYIGSAGTNPKSKNTLWGRYREFAGRHTAMFPVWALLYSGWKLEYLWLCCDNPAAKEKEYKEKYKRLHGDNLPPLVKE